jgi:hypothetical protein
MQIAAEHSEAVSKSAGMSVEKWLLFDGITLHPGDVSKRSIERAAMVETNLADPGLSVRDGAAMAAGKAPHAIAIQFFPERGGSFADSPFRS